MKNFIKKCDFLQKSVFICTRPCPEFGIGFWMAIIGLAVHTDAFLGNLVWTSMDKQNIVIFINFSLIHLVKT